MKKWRIPILLIILLGLLVWYAPRVQFNGETLFYKAIKGNHLLAARLLSALGADIDYRIPQKNSTALHYAIEHNNMAAAKRLVAWGADPTIVNWAYRTPLDLAIIGDHPDLLAAMFDAGIKFGKDNNNGAQALEHCLSASHCSLKILDLILANGGSLAVHNTNGQTPIHFWVRGKSQLNDDDIAVLKLLLAQGLDINAPDHAGNTPLHQAAQTNPETIQLLLANGAKLEAKNQAGDTPLMMAIADNPEALKILLAAEADINTQNNAGMTPVHIAATKSTATLSLILDQGGKVAARDRIGNTPLHLATASALQPNPAGDSLALFAQTQQEQALANIKLLLAKGAEINARNTQGLTPLQTLTLPSHWTGDRREPTKTNLGLFAQTVGFLISQGAQVNAGDSTFPSPLHGAAMLSPEAVTLLLKAGAKVNARDKDGATPLHDAAKAYNVEAAKVLLAAGADVNAQDASKDTPLHWAALYIPFRTDEAWRRKSVVPILNLLLANGAKVNARDEGEETPLLIAASQIGLKSPKAEQAFSNEVVQCLVNQGAEVNAKNKAGDTPLKLATRNNSNPDIGAFLRSKGAKE